MTKTFIIRRERDGKYCHLSIGKKTYVIRKFNEEPDETENINTLKDDCPNGYKKVEKAPLVSVQNVSYWKNVLSTPATNVLSTPATDDQIIEKINNSTAPELKKQIMAKIITMIVVGCAIYVLIPIFVNMATHIFNRSNWDGVNICDVNVIVGIAIFLLIIAVVGFLIFLIKKSPYSLIDEIDEIKKFNNKNKNHEN
jgi:hypothetical protein